MLYILRKLFCFFALVALGNMVALPDAVAQEKGAVYDGFSATALQSKKILLFRPTVRVGEQSTAGLAEPNADWTRQARDLLTAELKGRQNQFNNELIEEPDLIGDDADVLASHKAMFSAVANSVLVYQFFPGNRLPTRKNKAFDWTLGDGTRRIAEITGADFGLFIKTEDQYGSAGRKIFQFFAAAAGVGITSGVHLGYAGLVDLRTGQLVWLNADGQMGGDVRDPLGMKRRVDQLLEDFPGITKAAASATVASR